MKDLQIFNYNANEVRTFMVDGESWWILKDVCDVLGLSNTNNVASRLEEDELTLIKVMSGGQQREMYVINESGLYNVIFRSEKSEAKKFRYWVTHEVLPSIRKTGSYGHISTEILETSKVDSTAEVIKLTNLTNSIDRNEFATKSEKSQKITTQILETPKEKEGEISRQKSKKEENDIGNFINITGKQYGYVRVSTTAQNEDRQIIALKEFGVDEGNIFLDKVSGKDFNRPQYKRLLRKLRKGDTLIIKSIDRLGRNYEEILEHWRKITKEIKASIVVLDMKILDTRTKHEYDVTGVLIADIVLALLGYISQMERENLLARQAEGIVAAKKKGVRFGRPLKEKPQNTDKYVELHKQGEISLGKAANAIGVPKSTFRIWVKQSTEGK